MTWRKISRFTRRINGQLVVLSHSEAGLGTYTDAVTSASRRLSIDDLMAWANEEFPTIAICQLEFSDSDLIGITLATFI